MAAPLSRNPVSSWAFPLAALTLFAVASSVGSGTGFDPSPVGLGIAAVLVPVLFGTVFAAVHHAEAIAHRVGEPYGTLVLSLAVTVIEVSLIVSLMLGEGGSSALARDTVLAVFMIVCNGLVGGCILIGGLRYHEQSFRVTGASAYLAVLAPLAVLTLVLPNHTLAAPGPLFAAAQLAFVSAVTLALYGVFLYIQTIRHREYFVVHGSATATPGAAPDEAAPATGLVVSSLLLLASLTGVIILAKKFAAVIDVGLARVGAPPGATGVILAVLILLPEGVAAVQAARRNELQTSLNLALGSSLATIGLTVPAVAAVSLLLDKRLVLGLDAKDVVLLALTIVVSLLTFGTGRTNVLFGFVHLVLFATWVFLVFVP